MKRLKIALVIVLCFSSNHALSKEFVDTSTFSEPIKKLLLKEGKGKKKSKLVIKELDIKSKIIGKVFAKERFEEHESWFFQIDIGSSAPIECYVFKSFDGPATSLKAVVEGALVQAEGLNNKKLSKKYIYRVNSGLIGSTPYVRYDNFYYLGDGDEKVFGTLKSIAALTGDTLEICLHGELGFEETFKNASASFIQAFEKGSDQNFLEVQSDINVADTNVGFTMEAYSKDEDGDIATEVMQTMLMPVTQSDVMAFDSILTEWSHEDGSLISKNFNIIENGALSQGLSLYAAEGGWQVEGTIQGKEFKRMLEHDDIISSTYGAYSEIRALVNSDATQTELKYWEPSADPEKVISYFITKEPPFDQNKLTIKMGPIEIEAKVDQEGVTKNATMSFGPITMKTKLLRKEGNF